VIFGSAKVGGVRRDIAPDKLQDILKRLRSYKAQLEEIGGVFLNDDTVKHRLQGVGVLTTDQAKELGAVGPTLRGSGVAFDMRMTGYAMYGKIGFSPVVETGGDCYARCKVRLREMAQSVEIIEKAAAQMAEGPIEAKVVGTPDGDFFARTEQPRGEVIYYAKGNGTKFLQRMRVRTPTFANIPPLLTMLAGCQLADVPVIVLTIDPCISCAER